MRIYTPGKVLEDPTLFTPAGEWRERSPLEAEQLLQGRLKELGHQGNLGDFNGTEWFMTDLDTIDRLARAARMPRVFRNDYGLPLTRESWRELLRRCAA